jgi:hypothetical protein
MTTRAARYPGKSRIQCWFDRDFDALHQRARDLILQPRRLVGRQAHAAVRQCRCHRVVRLNRASLAVAGCVQHAMSSAGRYVATCTRSMLPAWRP